MSRTAMWIVIASAATLASTSAFAAHRSTHTHSRTHMSTASTSGALAPADRKFMEDAARGGVAEVALGRLAAEKGSNNDVRSFGQMMVDDHSQANGKLQSLAASKGVNLPTTPASDQRSLEKKLRGMSGAQFDRTYMQAMVKDHKKDVAAFQHEASNGHDSQVSEFASQTLPTLQHHLQESERITGTVK